MTVITLQDRYALFISLNIFLPYKCDSRYPENVTIINHSLSEVS